MSITEDERIAEEVFNTMDGKVKCKGCGNWKTGKISKQSISKRGVCISCLIHVEIETTPGIVTAVGYCD